MVTDAVRSPPRFLPPIFVAHRVQQSHCSSIFYRVLLTHARAFSASQFVRKKKSPRIYTSMHSGGFELTKLTCTRLEDNLIRHRGDRHGTYTLVAQQSGSPIEPVCKHMAMLTAARCYNVNPPPHPPPFFLYPIIRLPPATCVEPLYGDPTCIGVRYIVPLPQYAKYATMPHIPSPV